jgi:hypothetical protein
MEIACFLGQIHPVARFHAPPNCRGVTKHPGEDKIEAKARTLMKTSQGWSPPGRGGPPTWKRETERPFDSFRQKTSELAQGDVNEMYHHERVPMKSGRPKEQMPRGWSPPCRGGPLISNREIERPFDSIRQKTPELAQGDVNEMCHLERVTMKSGRPKEPIPHGWSLPGRGDPPTWKRISRHELCMVFHFERTKRSKDLIHAQEGIIKSFVPLW